MKDATALAFEATSARPNSRDKRPPQAPSAGGFGPRPTSAAGWSKPVTARPMSSSQRKETFGATSSLAERQAVSGITQIGELEGEVQWQSDVRFFSLLFGTD